jgi:CheY-like chemotaxis protein/two-component sensor histidine kinase
MARQASLMRRLLDDLLDVSRITNGHVELRKEPVDVSNRLRTAAAAIQKAVEDRGQELRLKLPPHPVTFMADRTRLDQVIGNLLSNASKYTSRGGRIQLSGALEGSEVVFRCKDDGQGIERANLGKIFEAFVSGPKPEISHREPNLGIGLALAKQLTQLHGGTIEVASAGLGMGSEFTVRLPFILPPADAELAGNAESRPVARRRRSILVVEDNRNIAEVMKMVLEEAGHKVYLFSDAASVLSTSADLKADAVLLDIGLPGINGYELAARLRQRNNFRGAKFVAISGFKPREQTHEPAREFDHYLIKPMEIPTLLALLEDLSADLDSRNRAAASGV